MRLVVPAAAMFVFLTCSLLYGFDNQLYIIVIRFFAVPIQPKRYPFIDLEYIFASVDCLQHAIDVYLRNPCDTLGRLYAYSPLLLRATFLPSMAWTNVFGVGMDIVFLLSLIWLPPPRDRREMLFLLVATISPPVVLALERGNIDVLIFTLVVVSAMLWLLPGTIRGLSYLIVLLVGLLKFYPLAIFGLAVREHIKTCASVIVTAGVVLIVFFIYFQTELSKMSANIFSGTYVGAVVGAANLPNGVSLIAGGQWTSVLLWAALILFSTAQIFMMMRWVELRRAFATMPQFEKTLTVFGAALICGSFVAGQNIGYRGIFLLLPLPGLLALWRSCSHRGVQKFAMGVNFLVVFLMWQGFVTWRAPFQEGVIGHLLWVIRELAWWSMASVLGGFLLCFVMESRSIEWLLKCLNFAANPIKEWKTQHDSPATLEKRYDSQS